MAVTYEALANQTAGAGGVGLVNFTNIPQTYTDLRVTFYVYSINGAQTCRFGVLGDTGSNGWDQQIISAAGTQRLTTKNTSSNWLNLNFRTNLSTDSQDFVQGWIDIMDYANPNIRKSVISYTGMQNNLMERSIALYFQSTPLSGFTSVQFRTNTGDFGQGSRFAVYGIKRA